MQLPTLLQESNGDRALLALKRYYNREQYAGLVEFTGARFDDWDSTGTRLDDLNRFTADDLVAVSFLSVHVPAAAAIELLDSRAHVFAELLKELGPDSDLIEHRQPWDESWAGSKLWKELRELPDVGPTTASKLFARKRPRLRPIYDSVVAQVVGSHTIWEPLRQMLNDDPDLQPRLMRLREEAELADSVTALRVFDVVAWMEGKHTPDADWSRV